MTASIQHARPGRGTAGQVQQPGRPRQLDPPRFHGRQAQAMDDKHDACPAQSPSSSIRQPHLPATADLTATPALHAGPAVGPSTSQGRAACPRGCTRDPSASSTKSNVSHAVFSFPGAKMPAEQHTSTQHLCSANEKTGQCAARE